LVSIQLSEPDILFHAEIIFIKLSEGEELNQGENRILAGFCAPGKPCCVVYTRVMQSLHRNEKILFKDFQDFLLQSQASLRNEFLFISA